MNVINKLSEKFGNNLNQNVKLSNYSWFNLGGKAEFFFKPSDKNQLIELIKASKLIPSSLPGKKEFINEEHITMNFAFASVVSKILIKKGSLLIIGLNLLIL